MATGIVLDIFRCSLHDGPGIRTTVFLKGCPLSCQWCHNAESQARNPVVSLNPDRCALCGLCAAACPNACHSVTSTTHTVARGQCHACGSCVPACPSGALQIRGEPMSVDHVLAIVQQDAHYYPDSGAGTGGLTISGGEPMQQFDFSHALATAAKARNFHVVLETCGLAPPERFRAIRLLVDLFLFDYKETNSTRHAQLTGSPNEPILHNLALLYAEEANIIVRCPLIPGINDTDEHLAGIAALAQRYPRLAGLEIMPYHNLGTEKARRAGLPIPLDLPSATDSQKQSWRTRLAALGCTAVIN